MDATTNLETLVGTIPHASTLGIELRAATGQAVEGSMPWKAEHCTTGGVLHGGAVMAFADTLGAVLAFLNLPEGASTATLESKTNFFRPVASGLLNGSSRCIHAGRRTIVVQTEVHDGGGRLVALTTQTQAVITG